MVIRNLLHLLLWEGFKDGRHRKTQIYNTLFFHEKGAIIHNTSLEKALNHKFTSFKLCVHLNDSTLQKVQFVCIFACNLQLLSFLTFLCLQRVNDVKEDWLRVALGKVFEIRHLTDWSLDKSQHFVVVLINSLLYFLSNLGLLKNDLFVPLFRQFSQITILFRLNSCSAQTVINERNFAEEMSWTQNLLFWLFLGRIINSSLLSPTFDLALILLFRVTWLTICPFSTAETKSALLFFWRISIIRHLDLTLLRLLV